MSTDAGNDGVERPLLAVWAAGAAPAEDFAAQDTVVRQQRVQEQTPRTLGLRESTQERGMWGGTRGGPPTHKTGREWTVGPTAATITCGVPRAIAWKAMRVPHTTGPR